MSRHLASQLDSVRRNLIEMGETIVSLLGVAIRSVVESNSGASARAGELEAETDRQHRLIYDQCLSIITLQAPVAKDARLVTGVLDVIVDLELAGDYALEIAMLSSSMQKQPPPGICSELSGIGARILTCLTTAIESWRSGNREQAQSVRPQAVAIGAECRTMYQRLSPLVSSPDESIDVSILLTCRYLERVLRHAVSTAEQAANAGPMDPLA